MGAEMGTVVASMFALLFSALAGGIWIGLALGATGALLLFVFRDIPLDKLLAQYTWNILTTQELLALPLFILMGEILFHTGIAVKVIDVFPRVTVKVLPTAIVPPIVIVPISATSTAAPM